MLKMFLWSDNGVIRYHAMKIRDLKMIVKGSNS